MNVKTLQIPHPFRVIWWRNLGDLRGEILIKSHNRAAFIMSKFNMATQFALMQSNENMPFSVELWILRYST